MSKQGQLWTSEEEKDILDRIRAGKSSDVIARDCGRTAKAIEYRLASYCRKEMMKGKELIALAKEFHKDPFIIQQTIDQLSLQQPVRRIDDDIREMKEQIEKIYRLVLKIAKYQKRSTESFS
jgi:hypothetical protein